MSGCVALCRPLPEVVVAWFVTDFRTSSLRNVGSFVLAQGAE